MTYEQATQQALNLRNQGITYPKIEEHLRAAGYVSSRTKKPVSALAVRHMVTEAQLREKQELKDEKSGVEFRSKDMDVIDTLKKLLAIPEVSSSMKLKLVKALIVEEDKLNGAAKEERTYKEERA